MRGLMMLLIIMLISGMACSESEQSASTPVEDLDAISLMELAFEGNYNQEEIKSLLDKVLPLYGLESNEENYMSAGNVLVALRKESKVGLTEMDILHYMALTGAPPANMKFPDMAAIAFTTLETSKEERDWFFSALTATPD